jgi:serine/threonine protein kinase
VTADWVVKVGDFGISKFMASKVVSRQRLSGNHSTHTPADDSCAYAPFEGTPLYSSPNALAGRPNPLADDVWSFGMVIYQMWEGCTPFSENWERRVGTGKVEHRSQLCGRPPFRDELQQVAEAGWRPAFTPGKSPDWIAQLANSCWALRASDRPTFHELESTMRALQRRPAAEFPP